MLDIDYLCITLYYIINLINKTSSFQLSQILVIYFVNYNNYKIYINYYRHTIDFKIILKSFTNSV